MPELWSINDVPITDYLVTYGVDRVKQEIELVTQIMTKIEKEIYDTKENYIRNGLIDLGWMPPEQAAKLTEDLAIAERTIQHWVDFSDDIRRRFEEAMFGL